MKTTTKSSNTSWEHEMNPRIKQLAGQAKFMAEETINKKISKNAELDAFAEKFAELIVQECLNKIETQKRKST